MEVSVSRFHLMGGKQPTQTFFIGHPVVHFRDPGRDVLALDKFLDLRVPMSQLDPITNWKTQDGLWRREVRWGEGKENSRWLPDSDKPPLDLANTRKLSRTPSSLRWA